MLTSSMNVLDVELSRFVMVSVIVVACRCMCVQACAWRAKSRQGLFLSIERARGGPSHDKGSCSCQPRLPIYMRVQGKGTAEFTLLVRVGEIVVRFVHVELQLT
jgi:hypothetical protein